MKYIMPDGEIEEYRQWIARMGVSTDIFPKLDFGYEEGERRAAIWEHQGYKAIEAIRAAAGHKVQILSIAKLGATPNERP